MCGQVVSVTHLATVRTESRRKQLANAALGVAKAMTDYAQALVALDSAEEQTMPLARDLTMREAAKAYNVSYGTIQSAVRDRKLPVNRLPGRTRRGIIRLSRAALDQHFGVDAR